MQQSKYCPYTQSAKGLGEPLFLKYLVWPDRRSNTGQPIWKLHSIRAVYHFLHARLTGFSQNIWNHILNNLGTEDAFSKHVYIINPFPALQTARCQNIHVKVKCLLEL